MEQVRESLRLARYSYRTEKTYLDRVRRFIVFAQPAARSDIRRSGRLRVASASKPETGPHCGHPPEVHCSTSPRSDLRRIVGATDSGCSEQNLRRVKAAGSFERRGEGRECQKAMTDPVGLHSIGHKIEYQEIHRDQVKGRCPHRTKFRAEEFHRQLQRKSQQEKETLVKRSRAFFSNALLALIFFVLRARTYKIEAMLTASTIKRSQFP